ncbi:outer membrane protein transport protein [Gracilimonas mengyeensis]|uniref:Outer membrane protein transport protein (OMPP1/FadL/TodX) n=1 Tax=Gracilimonas mengyeensis TaxID=1302730 RepID=A0A521DPB3_9BACT|nr:outer membrane protein transport protein [Gracilimonas mengyeensis]SMO73442.1 Outer membrane protein transport protein (OMPP1/FadL/TodX) [Gracilimonas mengyeensis]
MKRIFFLLMPLVFVFNTALAQDGHNQFSYSNLALQYSSYNLDGSGSSNMYPTVANANGYGSYLQNSASAALMKQDFMSFSLYHQQSDYENSYLGNSLNTSEQETKLGNIGFVYQFPVSQGSLVIGAGYNRVNNQSGNFRVSGRNNQSTITDAFKNPGSDYFDLAFETYAIDYGDVDSTYFESIFRIGFTPNQYPGINQEAKISYETDLGEYSFFLGTEFQKNLFIGISGGLVTGSYKYRRDFLETDSQNDYAGNFIPSDVSEEGTDIYQILTHDEIDADITGFDFRVGAIYKLTPSFSAGVGVLLPSILRVEEDYYASIETELDDNSTPFFYDISNEQDFNYRIRKPAQFNVGIAATDLNGFEFAASAEYTDYANLSLDFISDSDTDFSGEVVLREQQAALDSVMNADYKKVVNIKLGAGYNFNDDVKVMAGYAFLPGQSKRYEADKNVVSAGIKARIFENVELNLTTQYQFWQDRSELYNYYDFDGFQQSETMSHENSRLNIHAGIKFIF